MQVFISKKPFSLECGAVLPEIEIGYHTWGQLNATGDNVIWICHALTANSNAAGWWPGMIGPGLAFDIDTHFIVCANILGSCYGSTGPLSKNPETGNPWFGQFPLITIRDMVAAHELLCQHLSVKKIRLLAGGSMGGYQALEWAVMQPSLIGRLFLIATSAKESAWGIAIHTAQRLAIAADASWGENTAAAAESACAGSANLIVTPAYGQNIPFCSVSVHRDRRSAGCAGDAALR